MFVPAAEARAHAHRGRRSRRGCRSAAAAASELVDEEHRDDGEDHVEEADHRHAAEGAVGVEAGLLQQRSAVVEDGVDAAELGEGGEQHGDDQRLAIAGAKTSMNRLTRSRLPRHRLADRCKFAPAPSRNIRSSTCFASFSRPAFTSQRGLSGSITAGTRKKRRDTNSEANMARQVSSTRNHLMKFPSPRVPSGPAQRTSRSC